MNVWAKYGSEFFIVSCAQISKRNRHLSNCLFLILSFRVFFFISLTVTEWLLWVRRARERYLLTIFKAYLIAWFVYVQSCRLFCLRCFFFFAFAQFCVLLPYIFFFAIIKIFNLRCVRYAHTYIHTICWRRYCHSLCRSHAHTHWILMWYHMFSVTLIL